MDWETARKLGRRVFYEESTQTIRLCPENYRLADRRETERGEQWTADPDAAVIARGVTPKQIQVTLDNAWVDSLFTTDPEKTGESLAVVLERYLQEEGYPEPESEVTHGR